MGNTRIINQTKSNACGLVSRTPTLNLYNKINNVEREDGGIPMFRVPEVLRILREALDDEPFAFITHGYGLGTKRVFQNEIADMYGVDPNYVSRIIRESNKYLRDSKYRKQLNALVPTDEEIRVAFEKKDNIQDLEDRLVKSQRIINGYKSGIAKRDAEIEELRKRLEEEKQSSATLRKQLTSAEAEITQAKRQCNTISRENAAFKASISKINSLNLGDVQETISVIMSLGKNITVSRLEDLFADNDLVITVLNRAGISDIDTLCRNSEKNLTDLRVSKELIDIIKMRLANIGRHLRDS